jgi:hypothetical protein
MPAIRSYATPARRSRARSAARALGFAFGLCLLAPSAALAQAPSNTATAQADAAFEEGRELFEQGRFKEACEKFELSMRLDPSPGTLLNLGNCYEPQGDLLRALETFELALTQAQEATDRKRRQVWSDAARERIESLGTRIPQLRVEGAEPGSQVLLDGQPLAQLDTPIRYNPGRHQLEVSAPGKRPFIQTFELPEGQTLSIRVTPLEPEVATPAAAPAPELSSPPAAARDERRFGYWPWIAGGTGAALIGTSLVTGLVASSKASRLEDECPSKVDCDPSLESVKDSAHTFGITTDVLWVSGALILGAGVTLFVLDHGSAEPSEVQAGCFEGGCGFRANGRF